MPVPRIVIYEDSGWQRLLPLVYFRAVCELRCGLGTLRERVQRLVATDESDRRGSLQIWSRPIMSGIAQDTSGCLTNELIEGGTLLLNGRGLWRKLPQVKAGEGSWVGLAGEDQSVACIFADASLAKALTPEIMLDELRLRTALAGLPRREVSLDVTLFDWPWELVLANEDALLADCASNPEMGQIAGNVGPGAYLLNESQIHIGRGTRIKPCTVIDAENGPVWIGENVTIMPHSYVQGPTAIGDGCLLQPGAVVHEGTSIGPMSKVGGEIESSIIQGYSNKQHDGFLGHAYVGSWVNIAADCINSDLKNTYGTVRVPINGRDVETDEMFVGMLVGDFSKAGINVSFPTGAVIGFCSSVFVARSPKFVPSFAWMDGEQADRFDVERGLAVARKVMARRKHVMTESEEEVFRSVRQQAIAIELQPQMKIENWERRAN
jgi:UDP-N-acetylglucosamine diphosphorylase/glucosamine-1-phosphate N-acetyltransferase